MEPIIVTKCSFCSYSQLENGKLVCPFSICKLTKKEVEKLIHSIFK